ncbi:MAG TPA: carboxypeptidase regulatory-like domain-containing protein [Terriglobales bacterium]|nr:carboxypeptidase regulatory-like domain-containing protein [Terriglobales bacterium]
MTYDFRSMFGRSRFAWLLAVLVLIGTLAVQMVGQSILTGDIAGTVTDPSGAVVSGATVSAKSATTDVTQSTTTNSTGAFRLPLLKPGTYRLTITQTGFRSASQTLDVAISAVAIANIKLELGQTSETVEVTSGTPLIETENANISTTYTSAQVENLPNGGNDVTAYAYSAPGILQNTSSGGGYGNFTAFGLPATSNLFTVNGNDEMDPFLNLNNSGATNLLLGANEVEEVGVTSNGYTGQYGRMAGAQVNYSTKSGGNSFHGSAKYWYNDVSLNATDWFLNHSNTKPGFDVNNQYAAAIGGPIVKDKLFFFIGTEGLRYVLANSNQINLPNAQFQADILANLTTSGLAQSVPFYSKMFTVFNNAPGFAAATPVVGGGCGDFDGQTLNGHVYGLGGLPCQNTFRSTAGSLSTEWLMYTKVDWNRTNNDKWSIRMKNDHGLQPTYTDFLTPAFNATSIQPAWEGQLTNTHIFNNNIVNQFIGSVFWYGAIFQQSNASLAQQTFPFAVQDFTGGIGNISAGNLVVIGGEQASFPQGRNVTQYQLVDDVSINKGNHGLKFGVNFRRDDITDASRGVRTIPRARIFSETDFALGFIDQFSQRFPNTLENRVNSYSFGVYGQDEWRVTSKLKLNLTLRLDRNSNVGCPAGCFNRMATQFDKLNHDPNVPLNQAMLTGLKESFQSVQAVNVQPRFGFAYNLHQNTVLRGGIGMFSDLYPGTLASGYLAQAPQDPTFTLGAGFFSPDQPGSDQSLVAGCNTAFRSTYAGGGTIGDYKAAAPGCISPDYRNAVNHLKNPTYVEWNLELQHSIGNRTAISVNYVGNHGYDEFNYNALADSRDTNPFGLPIPAGQASPSGLPAAYPDAKFRNVLSLNNGATSNYNGLTAGVSEKALYGLQFSANYTWSHALDIISNGGILPYSFNDSIGAIGNPFFPKALNYSNADNDVRHAVNINYVWQPTTHYQGLMDRVVGGWTVSGTFFIRSGYPFTMFDGNTVGLLGNSTGFVADYTSQPYLLSNASFDCSGHNQTTGCFGAVATTNGTQYIPGWGSPGNGNFFCTPGVGSCTANGVDPTIWDGSFGHTRRNSFRGPHYFNSDFSVLKSFKLSERFGFGVGANFYNVFNHPNFGNPNHDLSNPSAAGITLTTVEPPTSPYGAFVGSAVSGRVIQLHAELKF